jgi:hypothetical protein
MFAAIGRGSADDLALELLKAGCMVGHLEVTVLPIFGLDIVRFDLRGCRLMEEGKEELVYTYHFET